MHHFCMCCWDEAESARRGGRRDRKLDERFKLGFFDDDDLGHRARRAGFELAVAHDLFVPLWQPDVRRQRMGLAAAQI